MVLNSVSILTTLPEAEIGTQDLNLRFSPSQSESQHLALAAGRLYTGIFAALTNTFLKLN